MMVRSLYIPLVICVSLLGTVGAQTNKPSFEREIATNRPTATTNLWQRVVLIGASATSGMKDPNSSEGKSGAFYGIKTYLDAALRAPHEPIRNVANPLFFFSPESIGKGQLIEGFRVDPSLVIGIDFLFWYCYGEIEGEEARLHRLENGLKQLETLKCPLVVGDIPDASGAANGILSPAQIPGLETIAEANKRIKAWAAARQHTRVLELATFMQAAVKNEAIEIHGERLTKTELLLQADKLHPTARGAAVLALAIIENALQAEGTALKAGLSPINWDLEEVFRHGWAAAEMANRELREKFGARKESESKSLPKNETPGPQSNAKN